MTEDMQQMYVSYCQITKERKTNYYVSKIALEPEKRAHLKDIVSRLSELKVNMLKSPITIDEDLTELQEQSEDEMQILKKEMEEFFD
jgi:hypothetical protein